jgi:hypothetical protein
MQSPRSEIMRFISAPITVSFLTEPAYSKKPPCPSSFQWQGHTYLIQSCLSEWQDFSRRGRMAQNMQPQHSTAASKKGSWGVGKFFFDVLTGDGRVFRLYYDRAPQDAQDRAGQWILLAELHPDQT